MTKGEIGELNEVWQKAKVDCQKLGKEATSDYLYSKVKISRLIAKIQEEVQEARKTLATEFGCGMDEKIPEDKLAVINSKFACVVDKISQEETQMAVKVLTFDELYDAVLSHEENKGLTTYQMEVLTKYLVKD